MLKQKISFSNRLRNHLDKPFYFIFQNRGKGGVGEN